MLSEREGLVYAEEGRWHLIKSLQLLWKQSRYVSHHLHCLFIPNKVKGMKELRFNIKPHLKLFFHR